ncbi:MAG: transporter substrate-binding domain-containing protein [Pseudomonadota bacterium]
MKRLFVAALFCSLGAIGTSVQAAPKCGEAYTVVGGDTLAKIARAAYQTPSLWPYIYGYGGNAAVIGNDPSLISIGISLNLPPCPQSGGSVATAPMQNDRGVRTSTTIEVVTGTDYPPFTDQTWENGGMLTEVVNAALGMTEGSPDYSIDWINDWAAHIDPLLERHKYDMGFPWFKPDCDRPGDLSEEDRKRCSFYFSEPLFDMLIVLFKRSDDTRILANDEALHGMRLCRPAGYFTFDLTNRGLIPGDTIELDRPQTVADCFNKLVDGEIDFVALNEFTGQSAIKELDYGDLVTASEQLTDTIGLRLIIHRDHPRAIALLRQFDQGLSALRKSGRYDEIVGRHLAIFHGQSS